MGILRLALVFLCLVFGSEAQSPIKHFIAVMLENRAFDHRIGWLKQTLNPQIDGLTGDETNPLDPNDPSKGFCQVNDNGDPYNTPNAGHSFPETQLEQFGANSSTPNIPPPMNGFVNASYTEDPSWGCDVMHSIPVKDIPVSQSLISNFLLIDKWFPGAPAPTEVNRMFYHSAQSDGWCTNPNDLYYVEGYPWESILHKLQINNVSVKVYMMDDISTTLFFKDQRTKEALASYHNFSKFIEDCANGTLASYNIIEPRYFSIPEYPATDEHPSDHTIYQGELMFKTIYDALRASPSWNESALLIIYDEHGGLYDHVPSPNSGVPDPNPGQTCTHGGNPTFAFSRLGVRIPAFVVSPWVTKGFVEHYPTGASAPTNTSQYEHSSVSRTLHDLFNLNGFLTQRDQWAATLVPLFNLTAPRTDCPMTMPNPPRTAEVEERIKNEWQLPINDFQKSIITGYAAMNGEIYHGEGLENQYEGHQYVMAQWQKFKERQGL